LTKINLEKAQTCTHQTTHMERIGTVNFVSVDKVEYEKYWVFCDECGLFLMETRKIIKSAPTSEESLFHGSSFKHQEKRLFPRIFSFNECPSCKIQLKITLDSIDHLTIEQKGRS